MLTDCLEFGIVIHVQLRLFRWDVHHSFSNFDFNTYVICVTMLFNCLGFVTISVVLVTDSGTF